MAQKYPIGIIPQYHKPLIMRNLDKLLLLFFFLVCCSARLQATQYIWAGSPTDSSWSTVANWQRIVSAGVYTNAATIPSSVDTAIIANITGVPCRIVNNSVVSVRYLFVYNQSLYLLPGARLTTEYVYINNDLLARVFASVNSILNVSRDWYNMNYLSGFVASPSSRVQFIGPNRAIISGWTKFWDVTVSKDQNVPIRTRYHNEFNNSYGTMIGLLGTPFPIQNTTNFTKLFIESDLNIDQGVLKIDQCHPDTVIDLQVNGNLTIGHTGGLNIRPFTANATPYNLAGLAPSGVSLPYGYTGRQLVIAIGENYRDNNSFFGTSQTTGLWFSTDSTTSVATFRNRAGADTTLASRPVMLFNGTTGDQTIFAQYRHFDWQNIFNQGFGAFLPTVVINKPVGQKIQMICDLKFCGNLFINSGELVTNGYDILFGDRNRRMFVVGTTGTFRMTESSILRFYSSPGGTGGSEGGFFKARAGSSVFFIGTQLNRCLVTRDAGTNAFWQMAFYSGSRLQVRFTDFNFQSGSNANYAANSDGTVTNCNSTDPASPCFASNGGLKMFNGALLDPGNTGNNFSECSFSNGANNFCSLLLNINTPVPLTINNVVFNGNNQPGLEPSASNTTRNVVSNNSTGSNPTSIIFFRSSGLFGGEALGEVWDDGSQETDIIFIGANRAEWIGSVSTDWSNAANWQTSPPCGCVPGSVGNTDYYIVISRYTAQRDLIADAAMTSIQITSSVLMNYVSGTGTLLPSRNMTIPGSIPVTIGRDFFQFGNGNGDGTTPGILSLSSSIFRVGGNFMVHDFALVGNNNTFDPGTSTIYMNGLSVQQIRQGVIVGTNNTFFNLTIDKPGTAFLQNNNGYVRNNFLITTGTFEIFNNINLIVDGNFTANNPSRLVANNATITFGRDVVFNGGAGLSPGSSTIILKALIAGTYNFRTNNQGFATLNFQAPATTTYLLRGNYTIWAGSTINADNVVRSSGDMGSVTGRQTFFVRQFTINGSLVMKPNDQMYIISGSSVSAVRTLTVGSTGLIDMVGTPTNQIKVSRDGTGGSYTFTVNGAIRARNVLFEFMDMNGINCSGSTAAGMRKITTTPDTSCFTDCIFTNGAGANAALNNSTYLQLPLGMDGNVYNVTFPVVMTPNSPAAVMASNVKRVGASVTVTFIRPSGAFSGPTAEWDPNNNIDWQLTNQKRWSGQSNPSNPQLATDWNTASNWLPIGVPTLNDDVLLDHSIVGPAYTVNIPTGTFQTRDLLISTSFPVFNPVFLRVNGNLTVNGFFTCSSEGYLYIPNSTSVLTFRRSYSNTGRISNGLGGAVPNRFVFDGVGINVISMLQGQNYPFFDFQIARGVWELNSNLFVLNDLSISSGATFDVSIGNNRIEISRNFTNSGFFTPRVGRVVFTDYSNSTVNITNLSNPQIITSASGILTFFDLRINKFGSTNNHVNVTGRVQITGTLDLQQRNLVVQCIACKTDAIFDNLVYLRENAIWTGANIGSFVDGRLGRTYTSRVLTTLTYPIGKGTFYGGAPTLSVELDNATGTVFSLEVFNNAATQVGRPLPAIIPPPGKVLKIANRYYNVRKFGSNGGTINAGANLANGAVRLPFLSDTTITKPAGSPDGMTSLAEGIGAIQDNNSNVNGTGPIGNGWNQLTTTTAGTFSGGLVQSSLLAPFTTLGNGDITVFFFDIVLPVQLFDFKAQRISPEQVNLAWNSTNERNLAGYKLLRAVDRAANFEAIATYDSNSELLAKGDAEGNARYNYIDRDKLEPGRVYFYRLQAVDADGTISTEQTRAITTPSLFTLEDIFPNPFDESATVPFMLETSTHVAIEVYDIQGRKVYTLLDREMNAGAHKVNLDATNLPSGIYNVQFRAGEVVKNVKVVKAATH
jgi:hypothetical protein